MNSRSLSVNAGLVLLLGLINHIYASPICTKILDSSSADDQILYTYFDTYVNGTNPWSVIAHDVVETSRVEFNDGQHALRDMKLVHPSDSRLYRHEFYTRRQNSTFGSHQTLEMTVCAPGDEILYKGASNTATRGRIAYGNQMGGNYKNKGVWNFNLSLKYWAGEKPICKATFFEGQLPGLIDCPIYTFDVPKSSSETPIERTEVQKLRAQLDILLEDARQANDEYREEALSLDAVLKRIENKSLHNLTETDLAGFNTLWRRVEALRKQVDQLLTEREQLRSQFKTSWSKANIELNQIVQSFNIHLDDFETTFAFKLHDTSIGLEQLALDPAYSVRVYEQAAQKTITKLKALNQQSNSLGFITEAKLWLDTAANMEDILSSKEVSSPAEWRALIAAFKAVENYIFSVVDEDFWFRDSALTFEQKRALDSIKSVNEGLALMMERDLRSYREPNMTPAKREILMVLEATGNGLAESGATPENSARYTELLSGLASAITEGATCIALGIAAGDFGDVYEVVVGKDLCTGEELTPSERLISSIGFIAGNGRFWRGVGNTTGITSSAKAIARVSEELKEKARVMGMTDEQLEAYAKRMVNLRRCN